MEKLNETMRRLGFEPVNLPEDEWARAFLRRAHYKHERANLASSHEGKKAMLVYRIKRPEGLTPERIDDTLIELHKRIREYTERNNQPKLPLLFAFRNEEFKPTIPDTKNWDPRYLAIFHNRRH